METPLKLNIGGGVRLDDEKVYLLDRPVGRISDLKLSWKENQISGNVSVIPSGVMSFVEFAAALAAVDISAEYHVPGEFWPNSYKRNGEWYAEYWDGRFVVTKKLQE